MSVESKVIAGVIRHPELLGEPVVATVLFVNARYFTSAQGRAAAQACILSGAAFDAVSAAIRTVGGEREWKAFFAKEPVPTARQVLEWCADLVKSSATPDFQI